MKSGILAAEAAYDEVVKGDEEGEGSEVGYGMFGNNNF